MGFSNPEAPFEVLEFLLGLTGFSSLPPFFLPGNVDAKAESLGEGW